MSEHLTSDEVRRLRRERGLTQHQTAAACGLAAQSTISDIERGLPFSDETDRRLREVLTPGDDATRTPLKVTVSDAA